MLTRDAIVASSPVILGSGEHHVLAVHGWFGSASGWGSLPEYLDGSAYTYVFMDLRGYGDRMKVSGQFTMAEAAADVLVLADELGWERFSLRVRCLLPPRGGRLLLPGAGRLSDR